MDKNPNSKYTNDRLTKPLHWMAIALAAILYSCARMGSPDGGWYDETPPKVVGANPADGGVNVKDKNIVISFDEYIKIDNPNENVVVSPPQQEAPEIKTEGKNIRVKLIDSLKPNTTYTVDFSSAISDNNEGNPLGNYTYTFSTGQHIDTLQVSGHVLNAQNLEPIKGILVGLYSDLADSAFQKKPMLRVARTDSRGHFTIKGVAAGTYRIYALQDVDGNYTYNQPAEMVAFQKQTITPGFKPDTRQDTIWKDSLRIANIKPVAYTHFLPDDICLLAFNGVVKNRYFVKNERNEADHFTLFYTYGDEQPPQLKGLNFNEHNAFLVQSTAKHDTITYWIKDSALINQDTLRVQLTHQITDTLGVLRWQTDTIELLSKQPVAKRMKEAAQKQEEWLKEQNKRKKRGEPYDSIMPKPEMNIKINPSGNMNPDDNVVFTSEKPFQLADTTKIHLYIHNTKDSLWHKAKWQLDSIDQMTYRLRAEWQPGMEYSLECDSTAFADIYGRFSKKIKQGIRIGATDSYATVTISLEGMDGHHAIVQLLDRQGNVVKQTLTDRGVAEFFYIKEGSYYLMMIDDLNNNGIWDTGDYDRQLEPEPVYYYNTAIDCKAKWDVTRTWAPTSRPVVQQKPSELIKQKADKEKTIRRRNAERARKMGITYEPQQE